MLGRLVRIASCLALAGCSASPYQCQTNAQCIDANGATGVCEAQGYCSFADAACSATSRRFADNAGTVASTCVPAASDACVSDLAGGDMHFCMVRTDGTVWCWGANDAGQLGDGTTADRATPVQAKTPTGKTFLEVRVSENHTCALAVDNTVWCWGGNDVGQLGIVDGAGNAVPDSPLPLQVKTAAGTPLLAKHVAAGGKHTCAIDTNDGLLCWGENSDGQCGQQPPSAGGTIDDVLVPTAVPGLSEGVVALSIPDESSAALKDDGSVYAFGGNANGQLGIGSTTDSYMPVQSKITSVVSLTAGDEHICAAKNDSSIWCWGYGAALGLDSTNDATSPQRVLVGKSVWAGGSSFHTCAVQGMELLCWGGNESGQVGIGTLDPNHPTVLVPTPALIATVTRSASSTTATCATTADGALWCWGANDRGQLAQGAAGAASAVPIRAHLVCN